MGSGEVSLKGFSVAWKILAHQIRPSLIRSDRVLFFLVPHHPIRPYLGVILSLTMASNKMSATTFFERLEMERATFDDEAHPLPKYQKDAFESCCKLLQEDAASLAQRSKQHRSSRLRARTLLIDVFNGLGTEVFLLCTLATTITKLSTITHSDLFPKLRAWWKTAEHPHGLTECANGLCDVNSIGAFIGPSPTI